MLGASNDFNAPDWNSLQALKLARPDHRYISCANYNHAFPPETMVADYLWFETKLKGTFQFPPQPKAELILKQPDGIPVFRVVPPVTKLKLKRVEMFYTDGRNPLTRFWITGNPSRNSDGSWQIKVPVAFLDEPLFAFANVIYAIPPIHAPNHRYDGQREMAATSNYAYAWPKALQEAGVVAKQERHRLIDDFSAGLRDWTGSLKNPYWWSITTRKISDVRFLGPRGAKLVFDVNSPQAGMKIGVIVTRNFMEQNYREHVFYGFFDLPRKGWNTVRISTSDLHNPFGWPLDGWEKVATLTLCAPTYLKNRITSDYARVAGSVAKRCQQQNPQYTLDLGSLPDKVSGWNERYYRHAGAEYTKDNMVVKDDLLARARFRNLHWEGGRYEAYTKPYVIKRYVKPASTH
ncbi:MAG: hypothetical protein D6820_08450 [Lentisphaerae bacterium]|nr:MAG: hypothetical protein D6820_08450 [Lentisphaerota bacterium]